METYLDWSDEQLASIRDLDHQGPLTMLNLLRFKPEGGRERFLEGYAVASRPFLERSGASIRYLGNVGATVIGGQLWDLAILVDYPSKEAFLSTVTDPEYPLDLRRDALLDSRLYCVIEPPVPVS